MSQNFSVYYDRCLSQRDTSRPTTNKHVGRCMIDTIIYPPPRGRPIGDHRERTIFTKVVQN